MTFSIQVCKDGMNLDENGRVYSHRVVVEVPDDFERPLGDKVYTLFTSCEHGVSMVEADEEGILVRHNGKSMEALFKVTNQMVLEGKSNELVQEWFKRVHEYEANAG